MAAFSNTLDPVVFTASDGLGAAWPFASVQVNNHAAAAASIFSDAGLTQPLANPIQALPDGTVRFYAAAGDYDLVATALTGQTHTTELLIVAVDPASAQNPAPKQYVDSAKFYTTPTGATYGPAVPRAIPAIYSHVGTGVSIALNYAFARGFVGISLNDYLNHLTLGAAIPAKPLILTFDDETTQWVNIIDPLLAQFGWKATGCISCGYPDGEVMTNGTDPFFYTNTTPLTWAQIRALGQTGRWDWANHSRTHPDFTALTTNQRNAEWSWCQQRIQTQLGATPRIFVHPRDADSLSTVSDAFAFGFQLVTIGPQGYPDGNPIFGPGSKHIANPGSPNRQRYVLWRDAPDALASIEDVYEPMGNRIPDMPMTTGDPYTVWTVTSGVRGSATNGVRMDQPQFSGTMDFRSNGTGNVSVQTSQYIAVKPNEVLRFAYFRQCGVSTGTFNHNVVEYDAYRNLLRTNTYETLTGTVALATKDAAYTVGSDAWYVQIQVVMASAPNGSFGTCQLPFFGSIR